MSVKTLNNKFNLISSRIKYGTDGGINVNKNTLVVDPSGGRVAIGKINPQYNLDVSGNININGYINNYGSNIRTQFYPALTNNYGEKDLSLNLTNRTITLDQPSQNGIDWSPELKLFACIGQQGLQGRLITSPDGINWSVRNNYVVTLTSVSQVNPFNCANGAGNIITCATTAGLAVGANVSTGGVTTSSPSVINIIDISSFTTSTLISGLTGATTLNSNCFTCTDTSGLFIGYAVSSIAGGGTFSSRAVVSIPSSTQFILDGNRGWSGNTCIADKGYQGMIWCRDLSGTGYFIAGSPGAPADGKQILTSTDGITWIRRNTPYTIAGNFAYSPTLKRVVATSGGLGFMYSDDGINWVAVASPDPTSNYYYPICWSQELRIFVSLSGLVSSTGRNVVTSPDGINWTTRTAPCLGVNSAVVWSPQLGIFCAIGGGTKNVMISYDGINWDNNYSTSVLLSFRNITWSPELGVFAATSGNNVAYSFDGKTWKNRTTPSVSGLKTIVWSSELGIFCFAGNGSSLSSVTDAVVTSNIQGRPPTSYNTFDVSFNLISENGLWTYRSFGKGRSVTKTTNFTISPGENSIIVNNNSGTTTATLPAASQWPGEEITIKTTQNQAVISASSNVVPINSAVPSNSIVTGTSGNWVTMVSDGTNWIVMKS